MNTTESELRTPRIELDYMFDTDEEQYIPQFETAAAQYAATLTEEEAFKFSIDRGNGKFTSIRIGKSILRAMSYADIGHQADVMQSDIERLAGMDDVDPAVVMELRAGQLMYGQLPDPE